MTVTLKDVKAARERIRPYINLTPVVTSTTADAIASSHGYYSANLVFKCENLQKIGAFKFRGATNAIRSLLYNTEDAADLKDTGKQTTHPSEKRDVVVITHSSGNHAQALALAARLQGVTCHVVMPSNAPSVKKDAVRGYGAIVTECQPTLQSREDTVREITRRLEAGSEAEGTPPTKVEFISPYDDLRVIAGQGTMALELMEQAAELGKPLDVILTPVGGGGMLSGVAVAAKGMDPEIYVVGAEPKGADDAHRSFYSKQFHPSINPKTVADGLLTSLGKNTFPLILRYVDAIFTVTEEQILRATKFVYERMKLIIEPSSAVPLAVVFFSVEFREEMLKLATKRGIETLNIGVVFSGGNVDLRAVVRLFDSIQDLD